jgi:hypothetical protein
MLIFSGALFFVLGAGFFFACYRLFLSAQSLEYRDAFTIICPETLRWAEVKVDGALAARTTFTGRTLFRLVACSRWPERQSCNQACALQVPLVGDDRRLTQFAPFALAPQFLRINNPVRMTPVLYARITRTAAPSPNA